MYAGRHLCLCEISNPGSFFPRERLVIPLSYYDRNILFLYKSNLGMVVLMGNVSFGTLFPISVPLRWLGFRKEGVVMILLWFQVYIDPSCFARPCSAACELGKRLCTSLCTSWMRIEERWKGKIRSLY